MGNDIPDWIHQLSMGNIGNAMNIINSKSNLPAVCGRVCAHERQCEGSCVLNKKGCHINIGRLEQFVADFDSDMHLTRTPTLQKDRGRIAVIGSGPAGLTVAGELSRKGFDVEIFEMEPEPGGVLMFGIPEYRLPKSVVSNEIAKILQLGVRINTGVTIGPDMAIDQLFDKGFDAIFMGAGAGKPKKLEAFADSPAVSQAIYFLRRVGLYNSGLINRDEVPVRQGDNVYVVGCGNTAIDAARSALRMGAKKVTIVYHRDISKMNALRAEYDDAVAEGVNFLWNASITKISSVNDDSHIVAIEADGTTINDVANRILLAIGSRPASRIRSTTQGITVDENGYVVTRQFPFGMTMRKGVFAGGDVSGNQATVVHAMSNARQVAEGIAAYVDALKLFKAIDQ